MEKKLNDLTHYSGVNTTKHATPKESVSLGWGDIFKDQKVVPKQYELNIKLSCLDAWMCYHIGQDRLKTTPFPRTSSKDDNENQHDEESAQNTKYSTPPWKFLTKNDLKKTSAQKTYLCNLNFLCRHLDEASGLSPTSTVTVAKLMELFKKSGVQKLLGKVGTTKHGRERRIDQISWEVLSRKLRVALKERNSNDPSTKLCTKRRTEACLTPTPKKRSLTPIPKRRILNSEKVVREMITDKDDVEEVVYRITPSPARKKQRSKKSDEELKKMGMKAIDGSYVVTGPLPDSPNNGWIRLYTDDLEPINIQGRMISGIATNAYLNTLAREYHNAGVRRVSDVFLHLLTVARRNHGDIGFFHGLVASIQERQFGDESIDWEEDELILIQVFRGHIDCGHWSLLVVDRTVYKPGIVVFFDSLPDIFPDTMSLLQQKLAGSPLRRMDIKWIQADMPKQGPRTNDCGIWMCLMASVYVKNLLDREVLPGRKQKEETSPYASVVAEASLDETVVGGYGRSCVLEAIKKNKCDLDDRVFRYLTITWKW